MSRIPSSNLTPMVNPSPSAPETPTPNLTAGTSSPTPMATGNGNSPWTVLAGGIEPVPQGSYFASFVGVEAYSNPDKGITNKWRWSWTVESGLQKGKTLSALTDQRLTTGTHPGRLISGMAGRQLQVGEDVQALVETLKGKKFLCVFGPGPKGGKPSVQSATLPPEM